jgi:hypothetical protein
MTHIAFCHLVYVAIGRMLITTWQHCSLPSLVTYISHHMHIDFCHLDYVRPLAIGMSPLVMDILCPNVTNASHIMFAYHMHLLCHCLGFMCPWRKYYCTTINDNWTAAMEKAALNETLSMMMFVDLRGTFGTTAHVDRASVFTTVWCYHNRVPNNVISYSTLNNAIPIRL